VKLGGGETFHRAPMRTVCDDTELTVLSSTNAPNDLFAFDPYEEPGLSEFVMLVQFNGRQDVNPPNWIIAHADVPKATGLIGSPNIKA